MALFNAFIAGRARPGAQSLYTRPSPYGTGARIMHRIRIVHRIMQASGSGHLFR